MSLSPEQLVDAGRLKVGMLSSIVRPLATVMSQEQLELAG